MPLLLKMTASANSRNSLVKSTELPDGRLPPSRKNLATWIWVRVWGRIMEVGTIFWGQFSMYHVKYTKALVEFPFFHAKYKTFQISQQQLQLSINDSNFFRRAIVNICTCKGDFGRFCFLQRAAFSEYL